MAGLQLYKASPAWGLPSYSAASLQAETYARLAEIEISADSRSSAGASPSGQLPALQDENGLQLPVLENDWDEFEAARCVISALKQRQDLDSALDPGQAAQCAAFTALIRMYLEPASIWTQWAEPEGYRQMKAVVGADQPFPLGFISASSQQRKAMTCLPNPDKYRIFEDATTCYKALANHLETSGTSFFFGSKPSSVDAFLYGHLCLHLRAPTSAPELQKAVNNHSVLIRYAENIAESFGRPLPPPPPPSQDPDWSQRRTQPDSNGRRPARSNLSHAEKERRRKNWYWLGLAGAVFAAYVLFSGKVIEFELEEEDIDIEE